MQGISGEMDTRKTERRKGEKVEMSRKGDRIKEGSPKKLRKRKGSKA